MIDVQMKTIILVFLVFAGTFFITGTFTSLAGNGGVITEEAYTEEEDAGETAAAEVERMVREMMEATGMYEEKARALAGYITKAGMEDADGFILKKNIARNNFELSFTSHGRPYTAVLSRSQLLEQIKDENGVTVFALIR